MNPFYYAGKAVKRIVICFMLSLLCALIALVRPGYGYAWEIYTYVMFAVSGILLLVSIFSTISVALRYLEGCQHQLDILEKILDRLPEIRHYDN